MSNLAGNNDHLKTFFFYRQRGCWVIVGYRHSVGSQIKGQTGFNARGSEVHYYPERQSYHIYLLAAIIRHKNM